MLRKVAIAVLFIAGVCQCALPGCQSDTKAIEQAIADSELTSQGDFKPMQSVASIVARDPGDVIAAIEHIYPGISNRAVRAKAAATLAFLASQSKSSVVKGRIGRLAEQMLFDQDPVVAKHAVDVLLRMEHPCIENLLIRRLREPIDKDTLDVISLKVAWHKLYNVIRAEICLPRPESGDQDSIQDWLNHVKSGVGACRTIGWCHGDQLPADFGPLLVALVSQDTRLCDDVVSALAEARPESAVPAIKAQLEGATPPSTRIAFETALQVLDGNKPVLSEAALGQLNDVVRRCRSAPELWPEVVLRTRWLAFASVYRTDDGLLRDIWAAIDVLQPRDKAELLSVVVSQYSGNFSSKRASTNRFILFLDTLPRDEFGHMVTLQPDLRTEITYLLSQSAQDTLPNLVSRDSMNAAAQRLAGQIKN